MITPLVYQPVTLDAPVRISKTVTCNNICITVIGRVIPLGYIIYQINFTHVLSNFISKAASMIRGLDITISNVLVIKF